MKREQAQQLASVFGHLHAEKKKKACCDCCARGKDCCGTSEARTIIRRIRKMRKVATKGKRRVRY